jgi:hypothetical protein
MTGSENREEKKASEGEDEVVVDGSAPNEVWGALLIY